MSLRFAHEVGFAITMTLGLLSVLAGGELPPLLWAAIAMPPLAMYLRYRDVHGSTLFGTALAIAAFGWSGLVLLQQGLNGSLVAAAIALIGIVVARLATRRTPNHDLQAMVLSLLMVFAGTVLHQEFTFGIVFVFYAVSITWALLTRQLVAGAEIEAYRTGGVAALRATLLRRDVVTPTFFAVTAAVALIILIATTVMFVLFPRVGLGGLGLRGRGNGKLPPSVSLLGTPRALAGGTSVIARLSGVTYTDFVQGLYLRGNIYDELNASGFSRSGDMLDVRPQHLANGRRRLSYEIFLEPVTETVLLTLGPTQHAEVLTGGFANPTARAHIVGQSSVGEVMMAAALAGPLRYRIDGSIVGPNNAPPPQTPGDDLDINDEAFNAHFMKVPDGLDPRITALAQQVTKNKVGFAARAAALRQHLLTQFTYTLDQPNTGKRDPLAAFLFEDRRGHCEYFATAFAVLLRLSGIPSRVVGGYQGGSWDSGAQVVVFNGSNAHAWVEWYEPHRGWVVDDATPPTEAATLSGFATAMERVRRFWDDRIVDFGFDQQLEIFTGIVSTFRSPNVPNTHLPVRQVVIALIGVALGTVLILLRRAYKRRNTVQVSPLVKALETAVQRVSGEPVPTASTLREAVLAVIDRVAPPSQAALREALQVYEHHRFRKDVRNVRHERQVVRDLRRITPI